LSKHSDAPSETLRRRVLGLGERSFRKSYDPELQQRHAELERAHQELERSEARFRNLAEMLPEVVYETDRCGRLTFINERGLQLMGYAREDFERGLDAFAFLVPEDRGRGGENMGRLLAGEQIGSRRYTALTKQGQRIPVLVHSAPIMRDGTAVGICGVIFDVAEQQQLEEKLQTAHRMESMGRLSGTVAHDFNNMLAAVRGYCDLLLDQVDEQARTNVEAIIKVTERAASLTQQLLIVGRRQPVGAAKADLNQMVRDLEPMLRRLIGERISLSCQLLGS